MNLDKNEPMIKFSDCCLKKDFLIIKDLQGILRRLPTNIEVCSHRSAALCHEGGISASSISERHVDWVISRGWFHTVIKYTTTTIPGRWYIKRGQLRINLQLASADVALNEINLWIDENLTLFTRRYVEIINEEKNANDMLAASKELLRSNGACECKTSKWRFW